MLRPFDYIKPDSLEEASRLLYENESARPLAGGTDLLVKLRDGKSACPVVVDIKGLDELKGIRLEDDALSIGALATVTDILESSVITGPYALLKESAAAFGCLEIRRRATVGGSIAHASPGGEFGSPMMVLEALVELHGPDGRRSLPVADFITGPTRTAIKPGEILTRLIVPAYPKTTVSAYRRRSRIAGMDLASMNLAVLITGADDQQSRRFRVAAGAMAATPIRLREAEDVLNSGPPTSELIQEAARRANENLAPRASSLRATPQYKKTMIHVLLKRMINDLLARGAENRERR